MDLRPSPIVGRWYPGAPEKLAGVVDALIAQAKPAAPRGQLVGVVVPHAGLRYSGAVAAAAFALLAGLQVDLVALLGPMHRPAPGALLTTGHAAYLTPLGAVPVDRPALVQLASALRRDVGVDLVSVRDDEEHALEMELPFLQRQLPPFRLLPVMLRDQRPPLAEALGHALAAALRGSSALLVASSDLAHYRPRQAAEALDLAILERLEAFDPAGVLRAGEGVACGAGAIAAVLWAARDLGAGEVSVVGYATSADVTGDDSSVIGYGAAAIWRGEAA